VKVKIPLLGDVLIAGVRGCACPGAEWIVIEQENVPLLDAFTRETLRLAAQVSVLGRNDLLKIPLPAGSGVIVHGNLLEDVDCVWMPESVVARFMRFIDVVMDRNSPIP
jgi:hypothetical protein